MNTLRQPRSLAVAGMALLAGAGFTACAPAQESAAPDESASVELPVLPVPVLHHVGLNVVDPQASIDWYGRLWPAGSATTVANMPAFETDMLLIFNQVDTPAPGAWDLEQHRSIPQSPFWHIGLNTDTTQAAARFDELGITRLPMFKGPDDATEIWRAGEMDFAGTLTAAEIPGAERREPVPGGFAFILGPDGEVIETNGGPDTPETFRHTHFFAEQPWCTAKWHIEHLGAAQSDDERNAGIPDPCEGDVGEPSWPSLEPQGTLRAPASSVSIRTMRAYPRQCQFGRCGDDQPLVSSRGQVLDHIGYTIPDLDTHIERLRGEGVTILEEISPFGDTRGALIEDVDGLVIHLVEQTEP